MDCVTCFLKKGGGGIKGGREMPGTGDDDEVWFGRHCYATRKQLAGWKKRGVN